MVRGWQKRAEEAEARRLASKQLKQRRESRETYKAMVVDLFAMLDRYDLRASGPRVFHVWTDSPPSNSPLWKDVYDEGKHRGHKKGRERANAINEEKRKAHHPRGKDEDTSEEDVPRLCRDHFFSGKCDATGKKGSCRHSHMPAQCKTLAQVVTDKAKPKEILSLSADANEDDGENAGGVDMMYYLSVDADKASDDRVTMTSTCHILSKKLANESCGIATVVYLAFNDRLLFDRYRGGIVESESELQSILQGGERRLLSSSVLSENDNNEDDAQDEHDHILLPSNVLEYILRFLPDTAVGAMSRVCTAWHNEIGQDSPELWRHLLERHQWPIPAVFHAGKSPRDVFRRSFIHHFSVVRDIEAVRLAAGAVTSTHRKVVEEKEMVYDIFAARRLAPQSRNPCCAVRGWSANHVLVAYAQDCTLRLFKAVDKTANGASPRACRELVCVSVKPHRNMKKGHGLLVAMDLDEDVIGCLYHLSGHGQDDRDGFILTVTKRDDFLFADGSGTNEPGGATLEEGTLRVFSLREAVLNYLRRCEEVDPRLLELYGFVHGPGDVSEVEVAASYGIHSCGKGLFLLEVAISILVLEMEDEEAEDRGRMVLIDRKVLLFSAADGAIVWMGNSNLPDVLPNLNEYVEIASFRQPGGNRTSCAFVSSSGMILSAELDSTGEMQCPTLVEACVLSRNELIKDNWQMDNVHRQPVVITSSDIVVAATLFRELHGERKIKKSVVSFYPRFIKDVPYATLTLDGDCEVIRIECLQDHYAVVLCRVRKSHDLEAAIDNIGDGWAAYPCKHAIVIHVPSRRVIHQVCLLEEESVCSNDIFFTSNGDTVGVGFWWKGVVLTGNDVREVGSNTLHVVEEEKPKSARKQRQQKKPQRKRGKSAVN